MNNKPPKKKEKKQAAKKEDTGIEELLDLLRTRPHLVRALIFDHEKVKRLLKSDEARRLIPGVDASADAPPTLYVEVNDGSNNYNAIFKCLKRSI